MTSAQSSQVFAAINAAFQGQAALPTPEDALRAAAEVLERDGSPGSVQVAGAFRKRLTEGGSLEEHLGLKVGRGRAFDAVHKRGPMKKRNDALRAIAVELPGDQTAKAESLRRLLADGADPRTAVFREINVEVPRSVSQLKRIIRGT